MAKRKSIEFDKNDPLKKLEESNRQIKSALMKILERSNDKDEINENTKPKK